MIRHPWRGPGAGDPLLARWQLAQEAARQWQLDGDYTYDLAGRLSAIDNASPTSATEPDLFIQAIQHNARGQATSVAYGNGATVAYGYSGITVTVHK
jgi:YD repeat-containing protein